ncbi:MAG: hypothetical protein MJZ66_08725 [Bacteroidales bacterium]|nr:hypothetical protein [Bacteroidales bacterium]
MKKILFLILTLLMCGAAMAQNLEDVIYLKSGGVVRGTLIEQVPSVKIKTASGDLMTIQSDDIDHIAQEAKRNSGTVAGAEINMYQQSGLGMDGGNARRRKTLPDLGHGLRLLTAASAMIRPNKYNCSGISVDVSMGMQFSNLYVGAGLSDEILLDYWYYGFLDEVPVPVAQMPVFAHARYDAKLGDRSAMADIRLGYSMTVDEYVDYSGLYINPSVGYRMGKITVALGMEMVKLNKEWSFTVLSASGNLEEKEVKFQKSIQLRLTLEWGGRN